MKCCEQYAAALSAFVDGELSENEKEEVLSHVEHCQNCREYLSELMIVHTMFEEMPELDAPEGFSERVLERVHEEKRERSRHRRAWPRVLAARAGRVLCAACRHGRGVEAGARDGQQQRQRRGLQYQRQ